MTMYPSATRGQENITLVTQSADNRDNLEGENI